MSSSKETLQHYFDALLVVQPTGESGKPEPETEPLKVSPQSEATSVTAETSAKVSYHPRPKPKTTDDLKPEPYSQALLRKSNIDADTSSASTFCDYPPSESTVLEHQKKQQLQKLLDQQALQIKPAKPVVTPHIQVEEKQVTQAAPAAVEPEITAAVAVKVAEAEEVADVVESDLDSVVVDTVHDLVEQESTEASDLVQREANESTVWAANGRPQWAQESRFDALLFDVSGLTLAVPLVSLGQIVTIVDDITPIFGQAEWFMGMLPTPQGKLRIVNTALFVMPEKYNEAFLTSAHYVISLHGVPWALAVDKVNQPVSLDPDDIRWRGERSKRPWLAGTVKSSMCALIDIPRMAQMLSDTDRNIRRP